MAKEPSERAKRMARTYALNKGQKVPDPKMIDVYEAVAHEYEVPMGQQAEHEEILSALGANKAMRRRTLEGILARLEKIEAKLDKEVD